MTNGDKPRRWTAEDTSASVNPSRDDDFAAQPGESVPIWVMVSIGLGLVVLSGPAVVAALILTATVFWCFGRRDDQR